VQAGFEKALSMLFPIITGATGIGTVGQVEGGMTFSFVQLVIDNEIAGYIKRILKGFEVNREKMGIDIIKEVGIGGNFIHHEHTAEHFRDEFYLSDMLERMPFGMWNLETAKGMEEKARVKAKRLIESHRAAPLKPEVEKEIDAIVERAKKAKGFA
jgi:trimethylamine--corrinoid protein Co-methyltransferase